MITLGAKPEQIIYANPCKQSSHIRYARDNDVKLVVFDSEEELVKMKKNFPNAKLVALLAMCFVEPSFNSVAFQFTLNE